MTDHVPEWPVGRIRQHVPIQDSPVFGGWLTMPSADLLAALCSSGSDYVAIDCQHTVITKIAGIHAGSGLAAERYLEFGFRLLTVGTEKTLLAAGVRQALERAGQASSVPQPPPY
jgi:2-keto-3-deoxy-L-rhamnonate aldolase RhmA